MDTAVDTVISHHSHHHKLTLIEPSKMLTPHDRASPAIDLAVTARMYTCALVTTTAISKCIASIHVLSRYRCGRNVKRSRYYCACCFCVVCSVCSSFRLPGLRELRVCSVCYRENMLRCDDVLHRGIRTETVAFCADGDMEGGEDGGHETWELVELDRQQASPSSSSSVLQIVMRPAPYTVLTGVLRVRQQGLVFGAWKVCYCPFAASQPYNPMQYMC